MFSLQASPGDTESPALPMQSRPTLYSYGTINTKQHCKQIKLSIQENGEKKFMPIRDNSYINTYDGDSMIHSIVEANR
jgi:hypothetical protein